MAAELEAILTQLGLQQYLKQFLDAGYLSWDQLTKITETQLASLNVKLGHRRKLQRAIVRARSWPDTESLPMTPELYQRIRDWQEQND